MEKFIEDFANLIFAEYLIYTIEKENIEDRLKVVSFLKEDPRRIYLVLIRRKKGDIYYYSIICNICKKRFCFPYKMVYICETCSFIFCEDCINTPKMRKHLKHEIQYTTLHRYGCKKGELTDVFDLQSL